MLACIITSKQLIYIGVGMYRLEDGCLVNDEGENISGFHQLHLSIFDTYEDTKQIRVLTQLLKKQKRSLKTKKTLNITASEQLEVDTINCIEIMTQSTEVLTRHKFNNSKDRHYLVQLHSKLFNNTKAQIKAKYKKVITGYIEKANKIQENRYNLLNQFNKALNTKKVI